MCLQLFLKSATDVDDFLVCGRLFHACGPANAKARLPNSVRGFGTTRLPADEERSCCLAATTVTGIYSSARYDGARLCRALYTLRHNLNSMRCGTRTQWRFCSTSYMWSFFGDGKWLSVQRSWPAEDDPDWYLAIQRNAHIWTHPLLDVGDTRQCDVTKQMCVARAATYEHLFVISIEIWRQFTMRY